MITDNYIIAQIGKAAVIGTAIVFSVNIVCLIVSYAVIKNQEPSGITQLMTIILGIIAIVDIGAAFFLKKQLLMPVLKYDAPPTEDYLSQIILKITIIVSSLCAAPAIYGLAAVFFGAKTEVMAGFVISSLAGFMLLRLRPRDFKNLIK
ncbi:MAG: hypothetical protein J7K40_06825 [candidate division Zixibacteria bacterium]|nr:hypothetical protein [candidate division Zixibacteria bacterium]